MRTQNQQLAFVVGMVALTGAAGCALENDVGIADRAGTSVSALVKLGESTQSCRTLFAGQTIDAGTVCLAVDNTVDTSATCGAGARGALTVTYTTSGGWELVEAHLAAGGNLGDIPVNRAGNPQIGNFPYKSGDITGSDSYTFAVPLCAFGLDGSQETCDPVTAFLAAHAVVRRANGDGTYRTETGWAGGTRFVTRGSWAQYFDAQLTCEKSSQEPPKPLTCETAWAWMPQAYTFDCSVPNGADPADYNCGPAGEISDKWGWYAAFNTTSDSSTWNATLYAGAGRNDRTKAAIAGTASIDCDGESCKVTANTSGEWKLEDFQAYVSCEPPTTAAPGQLTYNWSADVSYAAGSGSYTATVPNPACGGTETPPMYVAIHTTVCRPAE